MSGARRLTLGAAALLAVILVACGGDSSFGDPENPVSQIPWPDYERLTYAMLDQTDAELGTMVLETIREGDEFLLRLLFELESEEGLVRDEVRVWVEAATLRPLRYEREASAPTVDETISVSGEYVTDSDGEVYADVVVVRAEGLDTDEPSEERITERVDAGEFAFDNDSSAWLWRSLAFEQDLELTYRSVNLPQQRSQLVQVAVRGQDQLRGPEGDVVTWQVVATPGVEVSRAWYEVDPPHRLVRWDQQPRRFVLIEIATEPE